MFKNKWAREAIHMNVTTTFSFWDRFRILFGWGHMVSLVTEVEFVANKIDTVETHGHVTAPKWWLWLFPTKPQGMMEETPDS